MLTPCPCWVAIECSSGWGTHFLIALNNSFLRLLCCTQTPNKTYPGLACRSLDFALLTLSGVRGLESYTLSPHFCHFSLPHSDSSLPISLPPRLLAENIRLLVGREGGGGIPFREVCGWITSQTQHPGLPGLFSVLAGQGESVVLTAITLCEGPGGWGIECLSQASQGPIPSHGRQILRVTPGLGLFL